MLSNLFITNDVVKNDYKIPLQSLSKKLPECHPEFISGFHNSLILIDAETSSA